ncbi:MAG: SDR family oxidoreductase [Gammaproteobacteria bacterium]|nr:SDR family oxidoreductase [Gammaproteobacteria bacterium]MYC53300.1 SDR family oxidoreductase [Gammaproteobacteria bacterium]
MDLGLTGKVALVAASSRGLGRAVAEEFAREGARLVMCARGEDDLNRTRDRIARDTGSQPVAVAADLTDPKGVRHVADTAAEAFGQVDILVTNTGGPPSGRFEAHSPEAWRTAVAQNLESVLNLTRAVLPGMRERGWGRIINVTSIAVKQPVDGLILSNSVRAAVTGFARTLANEVARDGVTVNNVMPGYTRTARLDWLAGQIAAREDIDREAAFDRWASEIPAGRVGDPAEFAALVTFLASERASYITGTSIPVDGGWIRALV